eukprot:913396-Amphidinium_carterae.1
MFKSGATLAGIGQSLQGFKTEARNASRVVQAGIFLGCLECYERVPLAQLELFAIEPGFPFYASNMYSSRRRILVQGAVGELLHAFLVRTAAP